MAENEQQAPKQSAQDQTTPQGQFTIQKIYTKDISFETPNSPQVFNIQKWEPEVNVQLNNRASALDDSLHEAVLSVTITTKQDGKTAYLAEVQQAGIFKAEGFNTPQLNHLLGSYCPNILFPYVREVISNLVTQGGFPQMLLAPVNFEALYSQHIQQQAQVEKDQGQKTSH